MLDRLIVRFRRSNCAGRKAPSESVNQAMVSLADSDEMRPLLCEASSEGNALAIDIYQSRSGRPLLVHFTKEEL
jgi:hypothetical protein